MADDYNSDINTTGRLSVGGSTTGSIDSDYDADWFKIALKAGVTYLFSVAGAATGEGSLSPLALRSLSLSIADSKGSYANGVFYNTYDSSDSRTFQFTPKNSGDFFVTAATGYFNKGDIQGSYTLKASLPAADDYSAGIDTTGVLVSGTPTAATFERADDIDYFKFHAEQGQILNFSATGAAELANTAYRQVLNADGSSLANVTQSPFTASKSGDYYLAVSAGGHFGAYTQTMKVVSDDYSSDNRNAGQLVAGSQAYGTLDYYGDSDRFQMNMEAGQIYTLTLINQDGGGRYSNYLSLQLSDPSGSSTYANSNITSDGVAVMRFLAATSGVYGINVRGYLTNNPSYTLTASYGESDDVGGTRATAADLQLDTPLSGIVQATSDVDMFKIDLKAGVTYRFDTNADSAYISASLSDGTRMVSSSPVTDYHGKLFFTYTPDKDGAYYVSELTSSSSSGAINYTLTASLADDDYGASANNSGRLMIGATAKGTLTEGGGDRDWFAVSLNAGGYYWFSLEGYREGNGTLNGNYSNVQFRLLDGKGNVALDTQYAAGDTAGTLAFNAKASGTYFVEVASTGASGTYTVRAQLGKADDYGDDLAHATTIQTSMPVAGQLELKTDKDVFKFTAVAGMTYAVELTVDKAPNYASSYADVRISDGASNYYNVRTIQEGKKTIQLFEATKAGDYYVTVGANSSNGFTGGYTLAANAVGVDDYAASTSTTGRIDHGAPLQGVIGVRDDRDWIKVHLDAGRTYVFDLQGAQSGGGTLDTRQASLSLMDERGSSIASARIPGAAMGSDPRVQYVASSSGDYYLEVRGNGSADNLGSYTVQEVQTNLDTAGPKLLSSSMAAGAVSASVAPVIKLNFDETVMTGQGLTLTDANGVTVASSTGAAQISVAGHTLTFDPHAYLTPGMNYTLNLPQGSVLDLAGNQAAAQTLSFSVARPVVNGTAGDDFMLGSGAGLALNGGAGTDTVFYYKKSYSYEIGRSADGAITVRDYDAKSTVSDTLVNVERLLFNNGAYALDIDGVAGQVYRLYQGAFNRTPDSAGLGHWIALMDKGTSLHDVASQFIGSQEFITTYGAAPSDADFVKLLYRNVLHRDPEPAGNTHWLNILHDGTSRTDVLIAFSESAENHTNLAQIIGNGFSYTPYT